MPAFDAELDRMKRHPLPEVAAALGYERDPRKSSRATCWMRHPGSGHKIIVSLRPGGHYTFFTVGGTRVGESGTVFDLLRLANGSGFTLGHARKYLRPFLGGVADVPDRIAFRPLSPTAPDVERARAAFHATAEPLAGGRHDYLNRVRKLTPHFLARPPFAGAVFQDKRGNAVFPHRGADGEVTGFASRGPNWRSFSKGGVKSLFYADPGRDRRRVLVVAEAALSALSYAALHPGSGETCYLSTGGAASPRQRDLLRSAFTKLPADGGLIVAADADAAGERFAAEIGGLWRDAGKPADRSLVRAPASGDWNDELVGRVDPRKAPGCQP